MKSRKGIRDVVLVFALLLILSGSLPQPKKSTTVQVAQQYDAAAVIKLVTVRVLDPAGRPVMDLTKEDFVLFDNGKRKDITEFEIHTMGDSGMEVRPASQAQRLSETIRGMNRRMFLYLDIQGSDVNGMDNAKKAARHFLDTQLKPGDEVGLLGFSPTGGFFIQEYLTTDHESIRKALANIRDIEVLPDMGFISGGELDDSIPVNARQFGRNNISSAGETGTTGGISRKGVSSGGVSTARTSIAVPGSRIRSRTDFVPRMSDLAQALKYVPGNKSLVLFSGRYLGGVAKKLGREFASASMPVYSVNTKNWIMKGVLSLTVKVKHIWHEHPLKELSLASGGQYYADIEDTETISRGVQSLTGNYYVLGYYVPDSWDGKYHRIKVEVKRPGLEILAQDGYFNPKPYDEFTDFEKQLHLFDLVFSDNPHVSAPLEIPVEPLLVAHREDVNLALLSRLNVDRKTGISPARIEIFVFLFNKEQELVAKNRGEVDLSSFDQQTIVPCFTGRIPPGEYECRIAARDLKTGHAVLGRVPFQLPEKPDADITLSSPILFAAGTELPILNMNAPKSGNTISLSDIYKFTPRNHSLIVRDLEPGTEYLLALLPMTVAADLDLELDIHTELSLLPERERITLRIESMEFLGKAGATDLLMLELKLPGLDPGEYELAIEVHDAETQACAVVRKSIAQR